MVVHRVVAAAELQMEEGERSPKRGYGSKQKEMITPMGDIDDTYTHHAIRGILHLSLVELHLLLMQHRLDLRVLPSDDLK